MGEKEKVILLLTKSNDKIVKDNSWLRRRVIELEMRQIVDRIAEDAFVIGIDKLMGSSFKPKTHNSSLNEMLIKENLNNFKKTLNSTKKKNQDAIRNSKLTTKEIICNITCQTGPVKLVKEMNLQEIIPKNKTTTIKGIFKNEENAIELKNGKSKPRRNR